MADAVERLSVSLITQGKHRFYSLTMPSDELASSTFVTTRYDDVQEGFQRILDKQRAQAIADYIDTGGTIPSSVVLSAQQDAEFRVVGRGKTVEFKITPKSFLILDGQHRVYGFRLAKTSLRVPVIVYEGLSRRDEARIFIDINTKQRPVPNELLLDIKKLAEYENNEEELLGGLFDTFFEDASSPLFGLLSPAERAPGKISRVTFNAGLRPILRAFEDREPEEVYEALKGYLAAVADGLKAKKIRELLVKPVAFRSFLLIFPAVGQLVKDRFEANYLYRNFVRVLEPLFEQVTTKQLKGAVSVRELSQELRQKLNRKFSL